MQPEPMTTISERELANLRKRLAALENMSELSSLLSSAIELDQLMPLVIDRAKQDMDAEACSILFYNRETNKLEFEVAICAEDDTCSVLKKMISLDMGQGIAGWVAEQEKTLVITDARSDSRFFQGADAATGFVTRNMIAVPLIGRSGLIGVAEIINFNRQDYDIELIEQLCRQFAISIENAIYHRDAIKRERLKQELEIAATVQQSFLPSTPSCSRNAVTVSAFSRPAAQVGGDLYDFIEPVDGMLGLLIGDVSGKGISAALFMAKVISDFRFLARGERSPGAVLSRLNASLTNAPRGMFVTVMYAVVNTGTGRVTLACAGHPPAIHVAEAAARELAVPSGPPLGIMDFTYPDTPLSLHPGERLLFVTDGVFEAKNPQGERWGYETMLAVINQNSRQPDLMKIIVDYVDVFAASAPQADDTTLVEMHVHAPHSGE